MSTSVTETTTATATTSASAKKAFVRAPGSVYKVLSLLLSYPESALLEALGEMRTRLAVTPELAQITAPLFDYLQQHDLISLQENFVETFDRSRAHSLYLFEHLHGESRDRGQAMVDLLHEYQAQGYEPNIDELPDHVPLFMEFLSTLPEDPAREFLEEASAILLALGQRLEKIQSPYATVFSALYEMCSVEPDEPVFAPPNEMEETLETFGPSSEGVEPLMKPGMGQLNAEQTIQFYPKSVQSVKTATHATAA